MMHRSPTVTVPVAPAIWKQLAATPERRCGSSRRESYGDGAVNWKKALVVALVVLLVLIGIPILMPGMGGTICHECTPAVASATATCSLLAVLAGFALAITLLALRFRSRRHVLGDLLRSLDFDRPPQLA